ncbi:MAG: MerR family transcriptional regulator [Streptosporangiaceae bacterium]
MDEDEQDRPALSAGAVARLLGMAVTTLRSWDRRYGLGPSERSDGGHRRYTPQDLARLRTARRMIFDGVPAAEAARAVLLDREPDPAAGAAPSGGRTIPVGKAGAAARGLARAAVALDTEGMIAVVTAHLRAHGTVATWEQLLTPVLVGIGLRWQETRGEYVEVEHLLSWCISSALRASIQDAGPPASSRYVVLAGAPEEQHTLALEALAAALAHSGTPVRFLGPRVPVAALAATMERLDPAWTVVWSQTPQSADPGLFARLGRPANVLAAGPGWAAGAPLVAGDLRGALRVLTRP